MAPKPVLLAGFHIRRQVKSVETLRKSSDNPIGRYEMLEAYEMLKKNAI